ncbi:uncharacterized protein MICPUCDRAFT_42701 [Micromonas pusilla CCMP1545]|uniref:mitogen-activated protein kinase kinase n=1 Tax=Micromonas pusilla (strain CCMP1545) TaxID=564608 RepID=C1N5T7_MICPC|nr:uncharacterized protein MICPUCDRAFT_42701 [Micromonas pusilla CCMP1545]EEH52347.1 predicted protein [Micromonas pusilla CCMP1545]|eukprot:XP_003063211.1 predicted protein [Micromonas pusilla CCMP1545]
MSRPPRPAGLGLGLKLDGSFNLERSLNASADLSARLYASYNLTDDGIKLLSASAREFKLTSDGIEYGARGGDARASSATTGTSSRAENECAYRCASSDVRVFGVVGVGASGVVKRAIHVPSHRVIALKQMTVNDKERRRQIINEMRTLCDSPRVRGLVSFYGAFYSAENDTINIALEYVEGGSLEALLKRGGAIPCDVLGHITSGVTRGLEYLHRDRRVVHRDVKPGNVLMTSAGEPKITDFGISASIEPGGAGLLDSFKGTMCYMSPERVENGDYDFAADVWSLGLTVLECGLGRYPYDQNDGGPLGLMLQITQDDPPLPKEKDALRARGLTPSFEDFVRQARSIHWSPALYRDVSCVTTAQGEKVRGGRDISALLASRAASGAGALRRTVRTIDALPGGVDGGVTVFATGTLTSGGGGGGGGSGAFYTLVHEDWGGRGGGGDASSSGQFYVRNQLERWSSRE